ncbi:MAG: hypothetical protein QXW50_05995 [Nitrososphaerota archaeon]
MSELETIRLALKTKISKISWDIDGWLIILKDSNISSIKATRRQVGISFDWEWHFVAPVIISEGDGSDGLTLYREMKRREAQIKRKGIFRYNYAWVTAELLERVFPEIVPVPDLREYLNSDRELLKLLKRSSLDELYVNTYFELLGASSPDEALRRYYESPQIVGWLITAVKGPGSEWRFGQIVRRVYELLDYLAARLIEFTRRLESVTA